MADRWDKERLELAVAKYAELEKELGESLSGQVKAISEWRAEKERYREAIEEIEKSQRERLVAQNHMGARHFLKSTTNHFSEVWSGRKKMEARKADREYFIGDHVLLQEYDQATDKWSGREILVQITSVLTGTEYGIIPGFVILSIEDKAKAFGFKISKQIEENRNREIETQLMNNGASKAPKDLPDQDNVHA